VHEVGDVAVLEVTGKLTGAEAKRLEEAIVALGRAGRRTLVVNVERVRIIDYAGLEALTGGQQELRLAGSELRLVGLTRDIGDTAIVTRLAAMFNVFDSVPEAVAGAIPDVAATEDTAYGVK
jgi:anti-anti-sigma factor